MKYLLMIVGVLCFYCGGYRPSAQAQGKSTQWHLTVVGGTEFPVDVISRVTLETPGRLLLSTSLGVMPRGYVNLLNDLLVQGGAYPQSTADLIESALEDSLIWKTQVGVRPLKNWGLFIQGGYTLATLGGALTAPEVVSTATGLTYPEELHRLKPAIEACSTLHFLGGEIGYQWIVVDRLVIQLAVGGFATVSASSSLSLDGLGNNPEVVDYYLRESEQYLNDIYTSYVHAGYLSLQMGFQFF